jgi:hypothetical protein
MKTVTKLRARIKKWLQGGPRRQPARQVRLGLEVLERRDVPAAPTSCFVSVEFNLTSYQFGLTNSGQVEVWGGFGVGWTAVTGANTKATALVAADGGLFMLASNGALNQTVYQYSGSGTNWAAVTGANTYVTALASAGPYGDLYMLGTNGGSESVYVYNHDYAGSQNWSEVSPTNANPTALVANGGSVYMLANQAAYVYQITSFGGHYWSALTGTITHATALVTSGSNLYMLGSNGPNYQYQTVYQFSGSAYNWAALTGSNTQVLQLIAGTDSNLYMVASNGGTPSVWQYGNSGTNWTPLTGTGLQNALGTWQLGLAHPLASTTYSQVNGTLFGAGGPSYKDVQQGSVGDCWLLASLAETAARAPADIKSMFVYDGTTTEDGATVSVYSVRLYNNGVAQYFTVDTELPGGGSTYDRPVGNVLWAALAEKAYAEANGVGFVRTNNGYSNSYAALGGGGGFYALPAITGKAATFNNSYSSSDLTTAWQNGQLITLGTLGQADPKNPTVMSVNGVNIAHNHEYAVVGYDSATQKFTLFNPWGVNGAYESGTNVLCAGTLTATGTQLATAFTDESIGNGAAPGGHSGRHARSSQELADLAFIEELLDPHSKARRTAGVSPTSTVSVN